MIKLFDNSMLKISLSNQLLQSSIDYKSFAKFSYIFVSWYNGSNRKSIYYRNENQIIGSNNYNLLLACVEVNLFFFSFFFLQFLFSNINNFLVVNRKGCERMKHMFILFFLFYTQWVLEKTCRGQFILWSYHFLVYE